LPPKNLYYFALTAHLNIIRNSFKINKIISKMQIGITKMQQYKNDIMIILIMNIFNHFLIKNQK